eukprot:TRINITY_DN36234_c0_g1_i1.p1 TRINITY_DN36234_c0_g1~~TRINITY_DN36234_c0_g1_i1.p1  ORF type:complete len:124 (-),score=24.36 TRINITY_DN36234_c0_g1_i1:377-748(-)
MSLGQVLDSDCDEPPNIRTFLSVLILMVTLVTPGSYATPLPDPYLARIKLIPYPVNTDLAVTNPSEIADDSYAFLEISLTTPLNILLSNLLLSISPDKCSSPAATLILSAWPQLYAKPMLTLK